MPTRASRITFFLIFAVIGILLYRTLRPVFAWVGIAAFCAALSWRPYHALARRLGGRRRLAAGLCTVGVFLVIIAPLALTGWAIADQAVALAQRLAEEPALQEPTADGAIELLPEVLRGPVRRLGEIVPVSAEQLRAAAASAAQRAVGAIGGVVAGITSTAIGIFLWILSLYYFYTNGEEWLKEAQALLPLPERYSTAFFREFYAVAHAVFFGNILTAIAQGALGGIAFVVVGMQGAVLYGALIALAGVIPLVGAILVWGPAGIWLIAQGRVAAGTFMLLWGALVVGTVDNFLRPILTRGGLRMHPLLVFLSIFGGLAAFGFAGVLLGPLFAALFFAAVRIYQMDFLPGRKPPQEPEEREAAGRLPVH